MQRPYCQAVGYCKVNTLGHSLFISNVMDGFYLHIKVSIIAGAVITSPIWLYQLWAFIAPGLYAREKRWTYAFLGSAVPLFVVMFFRLPGDEPRAESSSRWRAGSRPCSLPTLTSATGSG